MTRRLPSLTDQELVGIDEELGKVDVALGRCEKLLRSPIPLGHTRYSVRFLWIWLTLLPFALVRTFKDFGVDTWWADKPQPVVVLAMPVGVGKRVVVAHIALRRLVTDAFAILLIVELVIQLLHVFCRLDRV